MTSEQAKDVDARLERIELALDVLTQKILPNNLKALKVHNTDINILFKVVKIQEKAIKELRDVA